MHCNVMRGQSHPRMRQHVRMLSKSLRRAREAKTGEFEGVDLCLGRVRESVTGSAQLGAKQLLPPAAARGTLATLCGVGGANAMATAELMGEATRLGRRRPSG